mmetsp:Transcript_30030/g.66514  ORF Transcript_30030/g.66514 Transcript_30030/m.66514 type:complete len:550 (-) Transcript_30030:342-1991(-)|eukprot:CAMPEP_0202889748 /NCGR_PEP_ID=MMETSP1392-20130828/333_1 /ASSEMBLY_ACC=CAM_ASM_000868 /TAXON_ID=225041 /ORGANISM="Chlamydomonas chlamydogama, Strain SAG 11-48b" /LENGTH=549 /DNA_ID=CAMNT_0049573149 /DNA_START=236 /DNA_END=1885 /DNA_ORIENTATION=-
MVKVKKSVKGSSKVKENETDEERKVRLEMEALAADENERRQQEAVRVALRERQLREQRYAHLNAIKIHNQWRKIMRMAKVEELRREIEILSQNHEREVDRKDAIVQMLDRDLEEAEEQYGLAVRGHMMVMDSLLDLQYQRMKALEAEFNADLKALEDEFEAERTEIINAHVRQKKDMNDMITAMEGEFADAENELRQEFEAQREEIKNRNSEDYNVLKIQLEGMIEELERHFEQAHKAYLESTEHRAQAFKQLTKNDTQAARVIEKRMKKLIKLQEALQHWRTKIATNSREWEDRNRALRNEKEIMTRHYSALKGSMDHFRAAQADRLKQLSLSSNGAMDTLKKKLTTAENILKLSELCRKYETEQEKVLPFFTPGQAGEEGGDAELEAVPEGAEGYEAEGLMTKEAGTTSTSQDPNKPKFSSFGVDDAGKEVEEWDYLNRFFKRFNKALLDKTAIDKERTRLEKENSDLRSILKQYLDGISVNDDVMNNPINPLMVVNNRLQVTLAERNRARQQALQQRNTGGSQAATAAPQLVQVNAYAGGGGAGAQ